MSQNPGASSNPGLEQSVTACSNCHLPMPSGLRFCRNCGYRLGEGPAEYTETVRFQNGHHAVPPGIRPTSGQEPLATSYNLNAPIPAEAGPLKRRRRKMSGMTWIFLGLLAFFLCAGIITAIFSPARRGFGGAGVVVAPAPPQSFFGVSGFDNAENGVTFENVEPPNSPADKAGLVGGDIITSFDGTPVTDEDELAGLLRATPIGKTVEVVYLRDGETKTTALTTISRKEAEGLTAAFRKRPEGYALMGYDTGDSERVEVPGMKIFGVRMGEIRQSRPADLAGVKAGDIIIEFDKVPIRTPEELASRVRRAIPYSTVTVVLIRGTERLEIPVKLGKQ